MDDWTGFTRHFTHLRSQEVSKDRVLLLTAILADAINLGLTKMAEACPGATYARLTWLQAWHIRDEAYSAALAEVVNAQFRHPFAAFWGDGTTSSSDDQYFRAGGRGEAAGQINAHYGGDPGVLFYTHVSDQYAPFHAQVINATVRDATYVLDGLLYHESDLRIEEPPLIGALAAVAGLPVAFATVIAFGAVIATVGVSVIRPSLKARPAALPTFSRL